MSRESKSHTVQNAIDTVARQVISNALAVTAVEWSDYSDIGEADWFDVLDRVDYLIRTRIAPEPGTYFSAYTLLASLPQRPERRNKR